MGFKLNEDAQTVVAQLGQSLAGLSVQATDSPPTYTPAYDTPVGKRIYGPFVRDSSGEFIASGIVRHNGISYQITSQLPYRAERGMRHDDPGNYKRPYHYDVDLLLRTSGADRFLFPIPVDRQARREDERLGEYFLLTRQELVDLRNDMRARAANLGIPCPPLLISTENTLNAFAYSPSAQYPDGMVVMNMGALNGRLSRGEVNIVLSHELAHVKDHRNPDLADRIANGRSRLNHILPQAVSDYYTRRNELEADRDAVLTGMRGIPNPEEYFIDFMAGVGPVNASRTHPADYTRVGAVYTAVAEQQRSDSPIPPPPSSPRSGQVPSR